MAYVNFSSDPMLAYVDTARHDVGAAQDHRLSALEWSVVALARRDRIASLSTPGRLSVAMGAVFGARRHSLRLADPRLEALRRVAVLTWHHGVAVPAQELATFLRAGFVPAQYDAIRASIAAARSRTQVPA